jgi:hypothetical protein
MPGVFSATTIPPLPPAPVPAPRDAGDSAPYGEMGCNHFQGCAGCWMTTQGSLAGFGNRWAEGWNAVGVQGIWHAAPVDSSVRIGLLTPAPESQRDSVIQPRVATRELPWVNRNHVHQP